MPNWLIELAAIVSCALIVLRRIDCLANDQLKRYEIINFRTRPAELAAEQTRPQINQAFLRIQDGKLLLVDINAFERHFRLVAIRSLNPLKVRVYERGGRSAVHSQESYFVGYLLGRPGSKVMGYLTNHRFIGLIYDEAEVYHLDLVGTNWVALRLINRWTDDRLLTHCEFLISGLIIEIDLSSLGQLNDGDGVKMYRESDVITVHDRASEPVQLKNVEKLNGPSELSSKSSNSSYLSSSAAAKPAAHRKTNRFKRSPFRRSKRDEQPVLYPKRPVACHVELIADHSYAGRYNYDTNRIANEMHLQLMKANEIYQATDFNQDGFPEGVSLRTASVIIFKDELAAGYTYANLSYDPLQILNAFSTRIQNHCLAFTFLYRDFGVFPKFKGTLGLAVSRSFLLLPA